MRVWETMIKRGHWLLDVIDDYKKILTTDTVKEEAFERLDSLIEGNGALLSINEDLIRQLDRARRDRLVLQRRIKDLKSELRRYADLPVEIELEEGDFDYEDRERNDAY